jgi:hypothetical protein
MLSKLKVERTHFLVSLNGLAQKQGCETALQAARPSISKGKVKSGTTQRMIDLNAFSSAGRGTSISRALQKGVAKLITTLPTRMMTVVNFSNGLSVQGFYFDGTSTSWSGVVATQTRPVSFFCNWVGFNINPCPFLGQLTA